MTNLKFFSAAKPKTNEAEIWRIAQIAVTAIQIMAHVNNYSDAHTRFLIAAFQEKLSQEFNVELPLRLQ